MLPTWPCVLSTQSSDFVTPWTVPSQAPLSMEFSRQEYWSGLPFPTPGDLPDPGIEPGDKTCICWHLLHWQANSLPLHHLEAQPKHTGT